MTAVDENKLKNDLTPEKFLIFEEKIGFEPNNISDHKKIKTEFYDYFSNKYKDYAKKIVVDSVKYTGRQSILKDLFDVNCVFTAADVDQYENSFATFSSGGISCRKTIALAYWLIDKDVELIEDVLSFFPIEEKTRKEIHDLFDYGKKNKSKLDDTETELIDENWKTEDLVWCLDACPHEPFNGQMASVAILARDGVSVTEALGLAIKVFLRTAGIETNNYALGVKKAIITKSMDVKKYQSKWRYPKSLKIPVSEKNKNEFSLSEIDSFRYCTVSHKSGNYYLDGIADTEEEVVFFLFPTRKYVEFTIFLKVTWEDICLVKPDGQEALPELKESLLQRMIEKEQLPPLDRKGGFCLHEIRYSVSAVEKKIDQ